MNCYKFLMWSIIYGLLVPKGNFAKTVKKRGVVDNFNDGLKVAGQMFGINTAADVANLVAKAFSNNNSNRNKPDLFTFLQNNIKLTPSQQGSKQQSAHFEEQSNENQEVNQQDEEETTAKQFQTKASLASPTKEAVGVNFGTANLITSMLRLVGFDATKLGALAINALIMIATAIGNTLMGPTTRQPLAQTSSKFKNNENGEEENIENGPEEKYSPNDHQPRAEHDVTTIEWFLQNSSGKMKRILKEATNTDLADKLTDMITNYETQEGQASCVKMLVCKSSPFIWGMQRSIRKYIEPKNNNNETVNTGENDSKDNEGKGLLNVQSFFTHLPSVEEYREYSEKCEQIYSIHCNTTDLFDKEY